ncbi:MAG: hypothetical protein R6U94_10805 [Nitriliruptoraceae bacterium]
MDTYSTPLTCTLAIDTLCDGSVLRELDDDHVTRLAEVLDDLPPVIVEEATGAVIDDGKHRVAAARRRGRAHVDARLVQLGPGEALAAAARLNARHGLPRTMGEKQAAVRHLLEEDPSRSNGLVSRLVGLSPSTVGRIRSRSGASAAELNGPRVGADGKTYPTDRNEHHRDVERLLRTHPDRHRPRGRRLARHRPRSAGPHGDDAPHGAGRPLRHLAASRCPTLRQPPCRTG